MDGGVLSRTSSRSAIQNMKRRFLVLTLSRSVLGPYWGLVSTPKVQDAFDVSYATVRQTIKDYGLQGMGYKSHYDKMFGEGAWDRGNNASRKRSHAAATAADSNGNEE